MFLKNYLDMTKNEKVILINTNLIFDLMYCRLIEYSTSILITRAGKINLVIKFHN